jgi:hypothetical protein
MAEKMMDKSKTPQHKSR